MKNRAATSLFHGMWSVPEWLRRLWPSRMGWHRVRRATVSSACGITLAAAAWYGVPWVVPVIRSHPYFALTRIEVDGNRRLTRGDVLQWVGIRDGTSVWDAAPSALRGRLQSHPWIRRVGVEREFPNRLTISVQERRPVAIVRLDALNYVDRSGRILGPLRDDDSRDFPVITGLEAADARPFATIGVHRALQLLRRCELMDAFDAVSEIHIDRYQGVTVFPVGTPVAVVLGWGGWREKLARSGRVIAAWRGQAGRLAAVDVSFRDLVVVKLRDDQSPATVRPPKGGMRV